METLIMDLVSATGLSVGTCHKVWDMVNAGASIWAILGLIGSSGGILGLSGAALWYYLKKQARQKGEEMFIAW
ncbi:circular bacteriocin, circularin A/uberolysin family [Bacillus sp. TL12]|uniref:circular bacteriocin, circularin A/uberolysin family n=1 Tax=Bacillus sp. TL12 TaxID=2894756 RepID=UPI001F519FCD|nr:circular bacteriocin, circularin A/uberolysin family [Bacillus sp. TL12]MCI0768194.1 uberolysin/carnocyclin family circular bacteriocin [Bacillus sp. TL12]